MKPNARAITDPGPISLLQFLPAFQIGGTERHVANLTAGIDRARFDLHVGCTWREGEFLAEIEARRIPITDYPIRRLYGVHALRQQVRFASYLRRNRIEIVHSYNFYANCFAVPAARLVGTPVIVASIRDTGAFLTPHQRRAQRMACRLANVVLVNAEAIRQWLIGDGYDPGKIVVIRNGIDLARFSRLRTGAGVRHELGVSGEAPVIAMLARVNRLKGIEHFLEAAASVAAGVPEARFLVVGDTAVMKHGTVVPDSDYRSELEDHIRRLGLQGRVTFTGFRLDVPELLSAVTVSVLPSLSEGLSNVVLESMAASVPVVATRVGGIPEAIEEGVSGLLVPPRDSVALANAMLRILQDRELAGRLGDAGRRRVAERFGLKNMVQETEQLYSTLLAQARGQRIPRGPLDLTPAPTRLRLRRRVKTGVASLLCKTGGDRLLGVLAGSRRRPLILCYHRVVDHFESHARISIPPMLVSRGMFEAHLDWIGRHYRFVSFDELSTHLVSGEAFDQPVAAVSFDDGYADVYENAFPVLKRKGIPAAVFVVTDLIGTSQIQIYDKLYLLLTRDLSQRSSNPTALARSLSLLGLRPPADTRVFGDPFTAMRFLFTTLPHAKLRRLIEVLEGQVRVESDDLDRLYSMTWDMISEMHRAGVTIGSHTRRHALLTHETPDTVVDELVASREQLERKLGVPSRCFAYPDGQFNPAVVTAVAAAGYGLAFTTCRHSDACYPTLTVSRRVLWEHSMATTAARFSSSIASCHVNGFFDFVHGCPHDHRGSPPPSVALRDARATSGRGSEVDARAERRNGS